MIIDQKGNNFSPGMEILMIHHRLTRLQQYVNEKKKKSLKTGINVPGTNKDEDHGLCSNFQTIKILKDYVLSLKSLPI